MKSEWALHIRETRAKVNRKRKREKKDEISYREAMKLASVTWEAKKKKIARKLKKNAKLTKINTNDLKSSKGEDH